MAEEDEIRAEVDAVRAVYGDDCRVINEFPPHLAIHIKPRTADDSSQQFVEVTLGLKSDREYPEKPPYVYIVELKGLDEDRQVHLITGINNKAQELSSCLMFVALFEEAVEILTNMNHPDGNCSLCLYPLVTEDKLGAVLPFMKLMSCYHCFHSDCIVRYWKWLQEQSKTNEVKLAVESSSVIVGNERDVQSGIDQQKANCPICRKVFDAKDMEHIFNYSGISLYEMTSANLDIEEEDKAFLQSDKESNRRQKFEALAKLQQERNGLIEPMKILSIQPGMFLPENVARSSAESNGEEFEGGGSIAELESNSGQSSSKATTSKQKNPEPRRKNRSLHPKRSAHAPPSRKHWIKKEP